MKLIFFFLKKVKIGIEIGTGYPIIQDWIPESGNWVPEMKFGSGIGILYFGKFGIGYQKFSDQVSAGTRFDRPSGREDIDFIPMDCTAKQDKNVLALVEDVMQNYRAAMMNTLDLILSHLGHSRK